MAGYYFVKSNGNLFRLTKRAYKTWVIDSAGLLSRNEPLAKIKHYGEDLGNISNLLSATDIGFETLSKIYSNLDTDEDI